MERIFILKGLECPHCSAKIEREVRELEGVASAVVNLMKQTLTVSTETEFSGSMESRIKNIVYNHEPGVIVSEYVEKAESVETAKDSEDKNIKMIVRFICGTIIFALAMMLKVFTEVSIKFILPLLIISYIILGADVVIKAVKNIIRGRIFDENFLMTLSTVGAFFIGEYPEAVAVMLFYQIGEFLQSMSVKRSRKSITRLMNIRPDFANVRRSGELITLSPEDVAVGEVIVVKPGEKIPLNGVVIEGNSMLDTMALTGESVPKEVQPDDEVLSGCINQSGVLTIRVTNMFEDSTVAKIIDLVQNASSRKAPTENFITTFARYYTPIVVALAVLLAFIPPLLFAGEWIEWLRRGMVFLVISCPCALVISIPLTFFGGIGAASKHGILVKGSNYLEALNNLSTVVFDKTGTLTKGVFTVSEIVSSDDFTKEQVLEFAAKAESFSNHPIAKSVIAAFRKNVDQASIENYKEIFGYGIDVFVDGKRILAGNNKLMEKENIEYTPCKAVGTKVYVAVDNKYAGCIIISDEIKADSKDAIKNIRKFGIEKIVMLTGDDEKIAKVVADELKIDEYYFQLLPNQKVEKLEMIDAKKRKDSKLAFVGDGINDAPVLARADIGIAMGGLGSDVAIEAADVVLMTDEPSKLTEAIEVAHSTKRIVIQNIIIALAIKVGFLALGAFGIVGMWSAVFADVGVTLIVILNAMRIMKK